MASRRHGRKCFLALAAGAVHGYTGATENTMLDKVRQTIMEQRLLARGERLLVGVSGGPDSAVLLDALAALAPEFGWTLHVAHFNHQLRGADADADAAFVHTLAAGYGLAFTAGRGDVRAFADGEKLSLEDAARRLRHGFFRETARTLGLATLVLGHTADDQAETLLQRLLRGAGTRGLAAMRATNRIGALTVVRPLLGVWKREVLGYAQQRGLEYRQDASNWDPQFQRNKIRHELIPALERDYNPSLRTLLHQTAEMLGAEDDWLDAEAGRVLAAGGRKSGLGGRGAKNRRAVAVGRLLREHVAVQRRAIYRWLLENGANAAVEFETVEVLRRLVASGRPAQLTVEGGARVVRRGEWMVLEGSEARGRRSAVGSQPEATRLAVPGATKVPALRMVVAVEMVEGADIPKPAVLGKRKPETGSQRFTAEWLDADVVGDVLWLRCWHPGDRFQPIGMKRTKKLQDIFVDAKVTVVQRQRTPLLVAANGEICWLVGYRIGERFKITEGTRRALRLRIRRFT